MAVISPPAPTESASTSKGASKPSGLATRTDDTSLKVAWEPEREFDHPAWVAAGRKLGAFGRRGQWWIGDWLAYGSSRWGEKYSEAARITGYDVGSLRNMVWIAGQFPLPRRRPNLTWGHHTAVAGLESTEQDRWLDLAGEQRLSVADLRVGLRAERARKDEFAAQVAEIEAGAATAAGVICPHCGGKVPLDTDGVAPPATSPAAATSPARATSPAMATGPAAATSLARATSPAPATSPVPATTQA